MIRREGTIGPREKIMAYTTISPDRAVPVTVTDLTPPQQMVWDGGMPLGLFKGVRAVALSPKADGITKVTLRDELSGLLLPLFGRSLSDLNPPFDAFVAGLKQRAER